jgi:hypothetical protein
MENLKRLESRQKIIKATKSKNSEFPNVNPEKYDQINVDKMN